MKKTNNRASGKSRGKDHPNKQISKILLYTGLASAFLILGVLSYFYLQNNRSYHSHYYEYYFRSAMIDGLLKKGDIGAALDSFYTSFPDKLILLRNMPFFFIFGPSHFIFSYSGIFLNFGLTLFMLSGLKKLIGEKKALLLTLLIVASNFYIELAAHYYMDLTYFLLCSLFFIYAALYREDNRKHNFSLAIIIFMLFTSKNASYIFVPVFAFAILLEGVLKKKGLLDYNLRFLGILAVGFMLFFILILNASVYRILGDIPSFGEIKGCDPPAGRCDSFSAFMSNFNLKLITEKSGGGIFDPGFLILFDNLSLAILLYGIVIFDLINRKNLFFVMLFFSSLLFLYLLFNLAGSPYDIRLTIPCFFIFIYLLFDFLYDTAMNIFREKGALIILIFFLAFFLNNLSSFYLFGERIFEERYDQGWLFLDKMNFSHAKVYIDANDAKEISAYYRSFIDLDKNFSGFTWINSHEQRLSYRMTDDLAEADYILCNNCTSYSHYSFVESGSLRGENNISLYRK